MLARTVLVVLRGDVSKTGCKRERIAWGFGRYIVESVGCERVVTSQRRGGTPMHTRNRTYPDRNINRKFGGVTTVDQREIECVGEDLELENVCVTMQSREGFGRKNR